MSVDEVPSEARLPTKHGEFNIRVFHESDTGLDHVALTMGDMTGPDPVLMRVHSECLTGDAFGSLRCDCGPQLDAALKAIAEKGWGVVVYLRQEGRGIGLHAKIQAYHLQDQGADTLDANLMLGLPADARNYRIASTMLDALGVSDVCLLSNNPDKAKQLEEYGINVVERMPLIVGVANENRDYLQTKAERMGHEIDLDGEWMVKIDVTYDGNLRCTATHGPSGKQLITDAPVDNMGKGESFSPTDLLATSMLTCIMTIVAIRADSKKIDISGMTGSVEKTMASSPRRVAKLEVVVNLPSGLDMEDRAWLISEGCNCPVCVSVSESMEVDVTFQWGETIPSDAKHWDKAYSGADTTKLGWYQKEHAVSMDLISSCDGNRIIDVGAGATTLIDSLVENGYEVTVLDISSEALRILSNRHGTNLQYINGDLSKALELGQYEIWHDRAVLHFLLNQDDREQYVSNLESCIPSGGYAVIETFSTDGAKVCCGLELHTYDEDMLVDLLGANWVLVDSVRHTHVNPFGGERPYISTIFQRK